MNYMKKTLPLIILALVLCNCDKDDKRIDNENIKLEPYIIENYSDDAKQLYFNEIFEDIDHTNYTNPILDDNEINKILKIIQAVYNSDSTERDAVFDVYDIHGYYCYSFNSISLRVNTELPEIKNLANNIFPTGETELDNLLTTYNFDSVKTSYSYPQFPWLTIYTEDEYNMLPKKKSFQILNLYKILNLIEVVLEMETQ